jgi:nucleoid DNA-binding protein
LLRTALCALHHMHPCFPVCASAHPSACGRHVSCDLCVLRMDCGNNWRALRVVITGFGTFSHTKRNARTGRNPKTGEVRASVRVVLQKKKDGWVRHRAVASPRTRPGGRHWEKLFLGTHSPQSPSATACEFRRGLMRGCCCCGCCGCCGCCCCCCCVVCVGGWLGGWVGCFCAPPVFSRTRQPLTITAKSAPKFKPSPSFKRHVNGGD